MAGRKDPFTPTVAARTRAAQAILATPALLALYESHGGLREDLEAVARSGLAAEAANAGQSGSKADGAGATAELWSSFDAVRTEYGRVMGVARAVRRDLSLAGADAGAIAALDGILADETAVRFATAEPRTSAQEAAGKAAKAARRRESLEAVRAEIQKDAGALADLAGAREPLARRKVDLARLRKLERSASALAGKLGDRAVKKGAATAATAAEHAAVREQKSVWGAIYRLLAACAREDARVANLLSETTRAR